MRGDISDDERERHYSAEDVLHIGQMQNFVFRLRVSDLVDDWRCLRTPKMEYGEEEISI